MVNVKKTLESCVMNTIELEIGVCREPLGGKTKFGGKPYVPEGFEWPYYEGEDMFEDRANRPLSFMAQFDLSQLAEFDKDEKLPPTGILSFFYDFESQRWGFDPKDKGCVRVFLFSEYEGEFSERDFPDDLPEHLRFPEMGIAAKCSQSYQSYEDFMMQRDPCKLQWEEYEGVEKILNIKVPPTGCKLLGWADPIQGNMTKQCELVASRGYFLGDGWDHVTPQDRQEAEQWANDEWQLLFQVNNELSGYKLNLGDNGRMFIYIRKEDLENRNFDNVWLVLQCK